LFPNTRIIEREYVTAGDFKNWAIPQAQHPWILVVDADERVTPELAREIQAELIRGPRCDGYYIYRQNHFLGHAEYHGDAGTDHVMRFFHRDRSRYIGPSDHGEVELFTGKDGYLRHKLLHYSAWKYDDVMRKFDRYTKLQAQQWQADGRDTSYFKLLVRPAFRFFREYILHRGFLDGKVGLQQAWLAAFYVFLKQGRLWELNHARPQPDPQPPIMLTAQLSSVDQSPPLAPLRPHAVPVNPPTPLPMQAT